MKIENIIDKLRKEGYKIGFERLGKVLKKATYNIYGVIK